MLGFLFKIVLIAAIVVGLAGYVMMRRENFSWDQFKLDPAKVISQLPVDTNILSSFSRTQPDQVKNQISSALDSLVTHPDRNSPVVLGVKVTNDSIGTITDVLMGLPSDQLGQIKSVVCTPAESSPTP